MTFFPFILPDRYILNCIFKLICWEGMAQSVKSVKLAYNSWFQLTWFHGLRFMSLSILLGSLLDMKPAWFSLFLAPCTSPHPPLPIYVASLGEGGNLPGSIILLIKFQPPVIMTKKDFKKYLFSEPKNCRLQG